MTSRIPGIRFPLLIGALDYWWLGDVFPLNRFFPLGNLQFLTLPASRWPAKSPSISRCNPTRRPYTDSSPRLRILVTGHLGLTESTSSDSVPDSVHPILEICLDETPVWHVHQAGVPTNQTFFLALASCLSSFHLLVDSIIGESQTHPEKNVKSVTVWLCTKHLFSGVTAIGDPWR